MTEASAGLQANLARKLVMNTRAAFSGLSASQIIDNLDDDQRIKLAATFHPESQTELEKARARGFAEATERMTTVLASEYFAGRESFAADLLANDKLSAAEITTMLAKAPRTGTIDADAAEDAARADMRARLAAKQPGDLGIDDGDNPDSFTDWGTIHAEVARERGL